MASCKDSRQRFSKMNHEITQFFNRLLECFVDYNLSKFEGFYDAFVSYVNSDFKEHPDPQIYDSKHFLFYYLKSYIDRYHILKQGDQYNFQTEIESHFTKIRNFVTTKVRTHF